MRPLFTIHAGEYLAGLHIQQQLKFKRVDTGQGYWHRLAGNRPRKPLHRLVTSKIREKVSPGKPAKLRDKLRCLSWFTLNRAKPDASPAEFWVFVLHGFKSDVPDFVVIPTPELRQQMTKIHEPGKGKLQSYFCSTESKRCWETRDLGNNEMLQIVNGTYENPVRDFTKYLNEKGWTALTKKLDH